MCEDVKYYCRICLDVESEHVPIFSDATIHLHMKYCLGMTVSANEGLPTDICVSCVSRLSDFYSFKLNAMFSQEWLESCLQENSKKAESKTQPIQPLPDSEYNSDSLLEFLNNTANIEEYLNNLGREDIPSIVNMLDRNNENTIDAMNKVARSLKTPVHSPNKREVQVASKTKNCNFKMEVDVLDSDIEIVNEILMKEIEPKQNKKIEKNKFNGGKILSVEKLHLESENTVQNTEKHLSSGKPQLSTDITNKQEKTPIEIVESPNTTCFACKSAQENTKKLLQHITTCDFAQRTCIKCGALFDSKNQMLIHSLSHNTGTHKCNCGKEFSTKENLLHHHKTCQFDCTEMLGLVYICKQCKKTFKERSLLYKHIKQHVLKADERICDICGHGFIGDEELVKHQSEFHDKAESNGILFRCKICSHTSPSHKELYIHVQKHLATECSDRHLCDTCGKTFKTSAVLLRHFLTHKKTNIKERDEIFKFDNTPQSLNGASKDEKNKNCYDGKRTYSDLQVESTDAKKCNICGEFFEDLKKRDCHVLQHIKMTVCEKCAERRPLLDKGLPQGSPQRSVLRLY